ncbi:glutathione peroxidase [Brevibacillus dissolubilis]|uniref:glutathione peroxidase n=1 Tax=Brevibacillus dissolubilis TaxID=1844116 RepID=UPI0011171523|nr:glutathione peroxidase [Brevibacillus dissolubilis]
MSQSIYDITVTTAGGEQKTLAAYQGQVLLIVNLASECGFTPQYKGLEELNQKYRDKGLRVLGFPCNDFGGQEPGSIEEIQTFCSRNFGVTFDLFDKVEIKGDGKHPLYQFLTTHAEPAGDVAWNFEKFLISKDGSIAGRFNSRVEPTSQELTQAIEAALA